MTTLLLLQATPVAADAGTLSWQYQLVMFVFATLGTIITVAVPLVARYIARKYKLEGEERISKRVEDLVKLGLQYAEEQVGKRAKNALDKPTSSEKLDMATEFVVNMIKDEGLPERAADAIKNLIEAKLPELREPQK
jgi:hypothetical protein